MREGRRRLLLILIMAAVSLVAGGIAIYLLYRTALEEERARLVETAQSHARLIEAIARHEASYERVTPATAEAATLSQVVDAHKNFKGFGDTGEFVMARRQGDDIVFLLSHRHLHLTSPQPVKFNSELAEPMRRALLGMSGSLVGLDYRGELVMAAYEPVAVLDLGIVAKIDMAEVQAPFFRAGITAGTSAILVVILGSMLIVRISNPVIRRLKEYSENLEDMVEERTRELRSAQEKLLTAERLATLGQLSGSISHELRNPLGVIDSSAYYLKGKLKDTDEKVQQHLARIRSGVTNATAIIESLLNLSRMKEPQLEKIDLVAITSDTIDTSKIPAQVNMVRNFPEQEVLVNADGEQLRIVFKNMIKNAVEAMNDKGTLTVTIYKTRNKHAEVTFADTGPGIAPENLEKIFQPLFSTRAKGIGFGLSIVKMVIDKHGGTVQAKSKPNEGAVLSIRLPLYIDEVKGG